MPPFVGGDYEFLAIELLFYKSIILGWTLWAWAFFLRPRGLLVYDVLVPERLKTFCETGPVEKLSLTWLPIWRA